ncbi:unnamed protein product [Linum trigynum]|uniref:Uncharacterized protein n=1 Tax=Linum trigynum TaxID=586398 RepID=A0AAV2E049_9ROSI
MRGRIREKNGVFDLGGFTVESFIVEEELRCGFWISVCGGDGIEEGRSEGWEEGEERKGRQRLMASGNRW